MRDALQGLREEMLVCNEKPPASCQVHPAALAGSLELVSSRKYGRTSRVLPPARTPVDGASCNPADLEAIEESLNEVQALLGLQKNERRVTLQLVHLPQVVRRPPHWQRHWLKYCGVALVLGVGSRWLYRHSWLSGSTDLEDWWRWASEALTTSWRVHVVEPLLAVRDELFRTFRDRPSIVSLEEFQEDKQSLVRMLEDFQRDIRREVAAPEARRAGIVLLEEGTAATGDVITTGMQYVMDSYEEELKHPIRNLVAGDLARSLLIQVQRLKVDVEAAMLELDQILRANELSITLVAAVPSIITAGLLLRFLSLAVLPAPRNVKHQAAPCRVALAQLGRTLERCVAQEDRQQENNLHPCGRRREEMVTHGLCIYDIIQVLHSLERVFPVKDRLSSKSEYQPLRHDVLDLLRPHSAHERWRSYERIMRSYSVVQP